MSTFKLDTQIHMKIFKFLLQQEILKDEQILCNLKQPNFFIYKN